jgi:hypothetical protein
MRLLLVVAALPASLAAQSSRYPVKPTPFPEAEEIALARSAAPAEISALADVWVLRDGGPVKVHTGTNGAACMVNRDLHEGSLYPICYDREGAATSMQRELLELQLRMQGKEEDEIARAVADAFANGKLRTPTKPSIAYMMSPRQVLFSSAKAEGRHVGAWHPHVMIAMPDAKGSDFGLATPSKVDVMSFDYEGTPSAQLVVKVPAWSDGTPANHGGR